MQEDGNLVLYENQSDIAAAKWDSGTYNQGQGPYNLKIKDDGNLVILDSKS